MRRSASLFSKPAVPTTSGIHSYTCRPRSPSRSGTPATTGCTIRRGGRRSAAVAVLHPAMSRPNLEVRCNPVVGGIVFEGARGVGVEVAGETIRANEVILCGGAINSPQLLQLAGVAEDLPVGENLQDHLEVYVQHACTQPVSVQPALKKWRRPGIGARWVFPPRG